MATTQTGNILRKLSDLVAKKDLPGLPDQQLLDRFTRQREEAAFEALVRRHGPLVLGVLRRALHNWHDAEDGFACGGQRTHRGARIRRIDRHGAIDLFGLQPNFAPGDQAAGLWKTRDQRDVLADAQFVGWIVESRFGGNGRFSVMISDRGFSSFEQAAARRVVQTVIEQFALAWRPIASLEPRAARHETNPQFAGIANSADQIIVSILTFELAKAAAS